MRCLSLCLLLITLVGAALLQGQTPSAPSGRVWVDNARDDGAQHYYAVPGSCAIIHWDFPGALWVSVTDPNNMIVGEFAGTGTLRTIPLHSDMIYRLRVNTFPDEITLYFDTPPSPQYPGNRGNGYVDPSCR